MECNRYDSGETCLSRGVTFPCFGCRKSLEDEMEQKSEKFYMVFVEDGNNPRMKHLTQDDALKEASALTKKLGKTSYVLEAIMKVEKPEQPLRVTGI